MKHLNRETIELSKAESEYQSEKQANGTVSLSEESFATRQCKKHTSECIILF